MKLIVYSIAIDVWKLKTLDLLSRIIIDFEMQDTRLQSESEASFNTKMQYLTIILEALDLDFEGFNSFFLSIKCIYVLYIKY